MRLGRDDVGLEDEPADAVEHGDGRARHAVVAQMERRIEEGRAAGRALGTVEPDRLALGGGLGPATADDEGGEQQRDGIEAAVGHEGAPVCEDSTTLARAP